MHRGAGAYICGEETALLESLEGERGMPRIRPPFPAIAGLYAKPTVVNNVETLSTVPHIMTMGGAEYAKLGVNRSTGTRIFSVSGHVNQPGNYEVELGMTFRDLIYDLAGGIRDDRKIKFFIPGGASSQWLTGSDEHLDAPLDMDFVQQTFGVMLGSGAVMVFDETVDPLLVAWRLAKFFAHESCGKCTPCREGTGWIEKVLYRMSHGLGRPEDLDLLVRRRRQHLARRDERAVHPDDDLPARPVGRELRRQPAQVTSAPRSRARYARRRSARVTTTEPEAHEVAKDTVTVTVDGDHLRGEAGRAADQGRAGARRLHPALLLARAHEAGRHVPHVPRRGRRCARLPARVHHAGRRRHGRATRRATR